MHLTAGFRLGCYEILGPLGAGGMGEVYKARDTKLHRMVAVKVLPPDIASDPDRLRRFEAESRAASALSHPNIVSVYDVGASNSIAYIAMEFVDGHSLKEILLSGPLPARRLLDIAIEAAAGLASAHEAGIIHRDLKPGNVMVSKGGFVKIVDFGLAKRLPPADSLDSAFSTGTKPGFLVGTVDYMSPEQASDEPLDFTSDQFAFGSVLYEMATGRPPFRRESTESTLAAIRRGEPEALALVRPDLPPPLRWSIERCLAKRPQERFASTRDLAAELITIRNRLPELVGPSPTPRIRPRTWWWLGAAASIALLGAFVAGSKLPRAPLFGPVSRFNVYPPTRTPFNFDSSAPAPAALSPDGRLLAFGAHDASGRNLLWIRPLSAVEARPIVGTDDATYPFWSPDGRFLGFFAGGKLKKVAVEGGPSQTLCDAPDGRGGTWNRQGVILFAPAREGPLYQLQSSGGTPAPATMVDPLKRNVSHRWPSFLPDGRHFLYFSFSSATPASIYGIFVGALGTAQAQFILPDASNATYASGHLLFARDRTLMAVPFDPDALRSTGEPVPIVEQVHYHGYRLSAAFTASATGVLAYQAGAATSASRLVWLDRTGRSIGSVGTPGDYAGLRISSDGERCAIEVREPHTGAINVWLIELRRGVATRVTSGAAVNDCPSWSPSGSKVLFSSNRNGHYDLYWKAAEGGGEEIVLESEHDKTPTDWSADGRFIVFDRGEAATNRRNLWYLPVGEGQARPLLQTSYDERGGRFSPDGRWLAYTSDESGAREIYIASFPRLQSKRRISIGGGAQPVWRRDGRELFYVAADNRIMAVEISASTNLKAGTPHAMFDSRLASSSSDIALYDVSLDGRRFLVNTPETEAPSPMTVVVNWTADLRR